MTLWPPQFPYPPPVTITATQSFTWVFRNVLFDAVSALPYFAPHFKRKTKMLPTQPNQIPFLGIYIADETMTPDGDANAGAIGFIHMVRYGFSVIEAANDPIVLEARLDQAFWAIMNGVWSDQYVMNRLDTWNPHTGIGNPDNVRVESLERGTRKHIYGSPALDNTLATGEMQYEITAKYRTYFEPGPFDDLNMIGVKTAFPAGSTVEEQAAVQQVIAIYEFPQN